MAWLLFPLPPPRQAFSSDTPDTSSCDALRRDSDCDTILASGSDAMVAQRCDAQRCDARWFAQRCGDARWFAVLPFPFGPRRVKPFHQIRPTRVQ
eukprot:CAMPEP_0119098094 /NCGR_PEP_ID=MMETSP1178-20130426/184411_1 /TAXON_ID=33656 /ORGANISM="unid sp, Strain CCMP2000" /LENGTH=94 /DNA_ID=CAMNT_0007082067 /DNA_START=1342 /DNA_END=1626 /DNA_ORIENTATION=+